MEIGTLNQRITILEHRTVMDEIGAQAAFLCRQAYFCPDFGKDNCYSVFADLCRKCEFSKMVLTNAIFDCIMKSGYRFSSIELC